MDASSEPGILAIWNDIDDIVADDYEHWYQRQHLYERASIPGFRYGRRHVAPGQSPKFFTFYETDSADVLTGDDYLARLNAPTDWTRAMMPHFRNVSRTVCRQAVAAGDLNGGVVATVAFAAPLGTGAVDGLETALAALPEWPLIGRVRVWQAHDTGATAKTDEAELRGAPDETIGAALVVEATEADAAAACARDLIAAADVAILSPPATYRLICEVDGDEIRRTHG